MAEPPGAGRGLSPEVTLAVLVALVVVALVGLASWAIGQAYTTAIAGADARTVRLAQVLDAAAGRLLRGLERSAVSLAGDALQFSAGNPVSSRALRDHVARENAEMPLTTGILDARGRLQLITDERLRPLIEGAAAGVPDLFRPPTVDEGTRLFVLRPAAESTLPPAPVLLGWRVIGVGGGFAVVVFVLDSDRLRSLVGGVSGEPGVLTGLATLDGELLFQSVDTPLSLGVDVVRQTLFPDQLRKGGFGSYRVELEPDGREGLVAFRQVGRFPVAAVAVADRTEVLAPWRSLIMAGVAAVIGLSGIVAALAALHIRAVIRGRRDLMKRVQARTREQRRIEDRLLAAERLTRLGHWEHDLVSGEGMWSTEISRLLGLAPADQHIDLGRLLAAIHPEDRDAECSARILASAGVKPYDVQYRIVRADGSIRHVHAQAEVLRNDDGEPERLIGTVLDITDRKQAEIALAESHAALLSVINATREDAVILVDREGLVQVANERAAASFGCAAAAEMRGRALLDLIGPEERGRWRLRLEKAISGAQVIRFEHGHGGALFDSHLSPAFAPDGRLAGVAVFERDITARKLAEAELRLLTRAIEQTPLSVIITDRQGRIEYVNPHFTTATGYSFEEVAGKDPSLFKSGYTSSTEYRKLWEEISCGRVWRGEFHNRRKNGELHWEWASIAPVRDEEGGVTHFVAVKEDITRRKLAEIELLAAKERAEAANLAKSRFLATVSHELRTPLNAILGFSQVIKESEGGDRSLERHHEYAGHIHANGTHLLGLINDLLDLAKIEAGKFELHETFFDLEELVHEAGELVRSRAEAARLLFEVQIAPGLPLLRGDDRAVRHILLNLLSNAIKFTPEGGTVTVTVAVDAHGLMAASVGDTGIGIAAEDIPKVVEPFGQVDTALSRRHDGTGLGLPLCRHLIELHGGHLDIASTVGYGTTVTIRFPRDRIVVSPLLPGCAGTHDRA